MNRIFQTPTCFFIISILVVLTFSSTTKSFIRDFDNQFKIFDAFKKGVVGFMVYAPESEKTLYGHHSEKNFTPVPNIKLFT